MKYFLIFLILFIPINSIGQKINQKTKNEFDKEVKSGIAADGSATREWVQAIKDRIRQTELDKVKVAKKILSPEEQKWLQLIKEIFPEWSSRRQSLHTPFVDIDFPAKVFLLVGNQGGDDGFTYLDNTICIDLSAAWRAYGDAGKPENRQRLIRLLNHEYTHLLHHAWIRKNPVDLSTPFNRALRDLIVEGVGNYRSLSDKWINEKGELTEHAKQTLKKLQPIFVERLHKLQTAVTNEEEAKLREGLSRGQFDKKWGALCVALWLAQESNGNDRNLAKWIKKGPNGIIELARKYLPDDLKSKFGNS